MPEAVAQRQVPVAEQVERTVGDHRDAALLVEHRELEGTPVERSGRAGEPEELLPGGEAAEADVLAVVGRRRRVALPLRQRLHRAAERRARLEQRHLLARPDQTERGRETGEPAADHDAPHRRRPPPTMRSFWSGERCGGPAKTS